MQRRIRTHRSSFQMQGDKRSSAGSVPVHSKGKKGNQWDQFIDLALGRVSRHPTWCCLRLRSPKTSKHIRNKHADKCIGWLNTNTLMATLYMCIQIYIYTLFWYISCMKTKNYGDWIIDRTWRWRLKESSLVHSPCPKSNPSGQAWGICWYARVGASSRVLHPKLQVVSVRFLPVCFRKNSCHQVLGCWDFWPGR